MRAVVSNRGQIQIADLPMEEVVPNYVLVKTAFSAISPGTEMMVKDNIEYSKLGYSASGIVEKIGDGVDHVKEGQTVACYGSPFVKHQEYSLVPKNLVVPLDDHSFLQEASMAGLGGIAIHALRQADVHFGENVIVVGLGIVGHLTAQIADAAGCNVIGYDLSPERCNNLKAAGINNVSHTIEDLKNVIERQTNGAGADSVLLCTGGDNAELIDQGLEWLRDRGKLIIVGDMDIEFSREVMFKKEIEVLISRAAGPGRFDSQYEEKGMDYPIGYVRWTEGRNLAEFVRLVTTKRINVTHLISNVLSVNQAAEAYQLYSDNSQDTMGIVLKY